MEGRKRAKLTVLLFLACAVSVLFLPSGPGNTVRSASASSRNPHAESPESPMPVSVHGKPAGVAQDQGPDQSIASVREAALLGGTCINCHVGITPAHTKAALKCVDCHGGNDTVDTGPSPNIRDKNLMMQAHVRPKNSRFFWANGIDDKFAGAPGKGDTEFDAFNNNLDPIDNNNFVGTHVDQEFNRDLNYVRFINPSDYRVAQPSCGSSSPASSSTVTCHGNIVTTIRKSIMATNQGQFATATYANHSPQGATNDNPRGTNPTGRMDDRDGEVTITFNYDDIDAAYNPATNSFNGDKLRQISLTNSDPFDDGFEATGAPIVDRDGQAVTAEHTSSNLPPFPPTNRLRGIGGKPIVAEAIPRAQKMLLSWSRRDAIEKDANGNPKNDPTSLLIQTVLNVFGFNNDPNNPIVGQHPIDAGFNGVRAFDPGLFPDVNQNFPFPFDNNNAVSILGNGLNESRRGDVAVNLLEFVPPNPFNRNRNSGCASCHMLYRADGHNEEPFDKTVRENGRQITTDTVTGQQEDKGERGYPAIHQLTTKIPSDQCGICHVFTTRVDVAFKGTFEVENNNFNFRWSTTAADTTFDSKEPNPLLKKKFNIPLQFTNSKGTKVNMFDNFTTTTKEGVVVKDKDLHGDGEGVSEDLNNNGILDSGEDKNGNGMLDIPDRLQRSDAQDGRQMRIMYGGATGAVRLMDIHLEKGMECVDCHFYQDLHGDGNIYTRNWDSIEIECQDCHGTAKKLATLMTSGPNGGNDLTQSFNENGEPFLEILRDGTRMQRSRVSGLSWRIPQVKEAITQGGPHFNKDAFEAMGQRSLSKPKKFAHISDSQASGKLECYTCHNAATPQCFACHYSQDYFPKIAPNETLKIDGTHRRNDQQMMEIWMGQKFVPNPNFFFFGIVRSPFVMGINGNTEFNKLSPFRSIMEINLNIGGPNGDTLVESTSFTATTHDLVTGDRPRSGSTLNPYMPHTVRLKETKDCDSCHTLRDGGGNAMNNNLLAGSFGLGTGRYHDMGDWVFAPLQGPKPALLMMDVKKETALIVDNAQKDVKKLVNNVFPGFEVDNNADNKTKLRKVEFDGTQDGVAFVDPRDTALIRNYIAKDHVIRGRDLAFVADGIGGLKIVFVTARDGSQIAKTERREELLASGLDPDVVADGIRKNLGPTLMLNDGGKPLILGVVPTTNAQGVAVVSSDLSDEFVYVADGQGGIKVVRIHEIFTAGPQVVGQVATPGFANKVRIEGNFLYVADGPAGLTVVDVTDRNNPHVVKTVSTGGNARDVAVYGAFAFIANGNNGMAVVDISNELNPKAVMTFNPGGVINDARGIDYADNRAYLADGHNGMRIIDITVPAKPELLLTVNKDEKGNPIDDAESVAMGTVPFRTFAILSDGARGLHFVNVTDFRDIRERLFADANGKPTSAFNPTFPAGLDVDKAFQTNFKLTLALRDPLTPFDRANLKFDPNVANLVSNTPFQIITFQVAAGQRLLRIAPGRQLDKIGDDDGRTLRDSTAVGARALSRDVMDKMRNVNVIVEPGTSDDKGNGLGNLVFQPTVQLEQQRIQDRARDPVRSASNSLFTFGGLFAATIAALTMGVRRNRRTGTRKQR